MSRHAVGLQALQAEKLAAACAAARTEGVLEARRTAAEDIESALRAERQRAEAEKQAALAEYGRQAEAQLQRVIEAAQCNVQSVEQSIEQRVQMAIADHERQLLNG